MVVVEKEVADPFVAAELRDLMEMQRGLMLLDRRGGEVCGETIYALFGIYVHVLTLTGINDKSIELGGRGWEERIAEEVTDMAP